MSNTCCPTFWLGIPAYDMLPTNVVLLHSGPQNTKHSSYICPETNSQHYGVIHYFYVIATQYMS